MANGYYSMAGFRLRLYMRLFFLIALLLPKGFRVEAKLQEPSGWAEVLNAADGSVSL